MITVKAPAKINLTLEVLRKHGRLQTKGAQPDGFHEIRSVLQTIDLCDTLHIEAGQGISFQCDMPGWSAEKSLVSRAVSLLQGGRGLHSRGGDKDRKTHPAIVRAGWR